MEITLKNVASYDDHEVTINLEKSINLFYGLNGSGKTTISRFLKHKKEALDVRNKYIEDVQFKKDEKLFQYCTISENTHPILVYNSDFIERHFSLNGVQGIYTIGEDNIKIEQQIKELQSQKEEKQKQHQALKQQVTLQERSTNQQRSVLLTSNYNLLNQYANKGMSLEFCKNGLNTKGKALNQILNINVNSDRIDIKDLQKAANNINDEHQELATLDEAVNELYEIKNRFTQIEGDTIWQKEIIGSNHSTIHTVINQLSNTAWVLQGRKYITDKDDICPFCQQHTIDNDFKNKLEEYFNEDFNNSKKAIIKLQEQYKYQLPNLDPYSQQYTSLVSKIKDSFNDLTNVINTNQQIIASKINVLSIPVQIQSTNMKIDNLINCFNELNAQVKLINEKIKNKQQEAQIIKQQFLQFLYQQQQDEIIEFKQVELDFNNLKETNTQEQKNIMNQIQLIDKKISDEQEKITSVDTSINKINTQLNMWGIDNFKLEKSEECETQYYIVRENGIHKNKYKTLSEGEKTLVSFLYFVNLCNGAEFKDDVSHLSDRIIVIDDPVSSVSHDYIYNISLLIRDNFTKKEYNKPLNVLCQKLIIMTHDIYFYNELFKIGFKSGNVNIQSFRVEKKIYSQIKEIENDSIFNSYEELWYVIKSIDEQDGDSIKITFTNIARQILEVFVGFIYKDDDYKTLLDDQIHTFDCQPFIRLINRKSHRDRVNLTDYHTVDIEKAKKDFHHIFKELGFEEHYNRMMGIESK